MGKLLIFLVILVVLTGLGLVAFSYVDPILGADFSAPQEEIRVPVTLTPANGS